MRTQDIVSNRASAQHGSLETSVSSGDFSSLEAFDRWKAENAAREAREQADRDRVARIEADNAALMTEAERDLNKTRAIDWLNLKTLDEHPAVVAALAALNAARAALDTSAAMADDKQARVSAAESAAARGRRDDAALTRTRADLEHALADQRIAGLAIEHADADLDRARRRARADAAVNLRALHVPEIRAQAAALETASVHSNRATAIENASSRLLTVPYTVAAHEAVRGLGSSLMPASWKREFHPTKGLFKFWVQLYQRLGYLD